MNQLLAHINIGLLNAPIDDPMIADFADNLDKINAIAEAAPGFVWRLKDEDNNATSFNPYNNELIIVNISVWTNLEALKDYAYHTDHMAFFKRRHEWFLPLDKPHMCLWWTDSTEMPDADEGKNRLDHLWENGPSQFSFDFRTYNQFSN